MALAESQKIAKDLFRSTVILWIACAIALSSQKRIDCILWNLVNLFYDVTPAGVTYFFKVT